ncbi:hypothetical protein LCGC14_2291070, partial [marine sediment metagenome]
VTKVAVRLDDAVTAEGDGFYDLKTSAFRGRLVVERADLAWIDRLVQGLGRPAPKRLAGVLTCQASAARSSADGPIVISGGLTGQGVTVDAKPLTPGEVKLTWQEAALTPADKRVAIKRVALKGSAVDLLGRDVSVSWGERRELAGKLDLQADLAGLHRAARAFRTDLPLPAPVGRLVLTGRCEPKDEAVNFTGQAKILRPVRLAAQPLVAAASGHFDPASGAFEAKLDVERAEVAYLRRLGRSFGVEVDADYNAVGKLTATVKRSKSADAPIESTGRMDVQPLAAAGKDPSGEAIAFTWTEAKFSPGSKRLSLRSAELTGDMATVKARDIKCSFGDNLVVEGELDLTADLAKCLTAAKGLAKWRTVPALTGQLTFGGAVRSVGQSFKLGGTGRIREFTYGVGGKTVAEDSVDLALQADGDGPAETITLRVAKLTAKALTVSAAGTISKYRSERVLDLRGSCITDWDRLTPLIHTFVPALAGKFALAGVNEGPFVITGPARNPKLTPPFRALRVDGKAGWASGEALGLKLGKAELGGLLADGRLVIPPATIPASGGKIGVGGTVDFAPVDPTLHIKQLTVLE